METYESYFNLFDELEFDHATGKSEDDKDIFYLESIEEDIRQYHRPE